MQFPLLDPVIAGREYRAIFHIEKYRHLGLPIVSGGRRISLHNGRRAGIVAPIILSRSGIRVVISRSGIRVIVVWIIWRVSGRVAVVVVSRPTPDGIDPCRPPIPVPEPRPAPSPVKSPARPPAQSEAPAKAESAVPATSVSA